MKKCSTCGILKSLDGYSSRKGGKLGVDSACRACRKVSGHEYYLSNKSAIRVRNKEWLKNNMSRFKEMQSDLYSTPSGRYSHYKSTAKRRGIEFSISLEYFSVLWQEPCHYCLGPIDTIGLDRADNSKGYVAGNIVPCCFVCNTAKNNVFSYDEMVSVIGPSIRAVREKRGGLFPDVSKLRNLSSLERSV